MFNRKLKLQEVLDKLDGAPPLCISCKYSTRNFADILLGMRHKYDRCSHPKTNIFPGEFSFCAVERKYEVSQCGPKGRLFERKSGIVRRVLRWIRERFSE